jgi:3-phosphoshikimate 1-carboxyvinyltransferase
VHIEIERTLSSVPFVDMTIDVMRSFGVQVEFFGRRRFAVRSGQRYKPMTFKVEADASAASYFLAAGAIAGGEVVVEGLSLQLKQGDIGFVYVLKDMGCQIEELINGTAIRSDRILKGIDVDMNSMPDSVPALTSVALFAEGKTRIRNVRHLRFKESDRLEAITSEVSKLGARVSLRDDELEIDPGPLHGAQLDTYDDHRLAMSFALAGLRIPGVRIENPDCVRKSFPAFWKEFEKLYGG